jgi:four helix bundle protein
MYTSLGQKKLEVYQQSPEFITWTLPLLDTLSAGASVRNQLDRASISVPLNIAEGKFTSADRCRFFDNARASALECAPGLDVMIAKQFVETNGVEKGNNMSIKMVSMLFGSIRAKSDVRVFKSSAQSGSGME